MYIYIYNIMFTLLNRLSSIVSKSRYFLEVNAAMQLDLYVIAKSARA